MIGQNRFIEVISINGTDPDDQRVLTLQRYLVDRSNYIMLTVRQACCSRHIVPSVHWPFLFINNRLQNVDWELDLLECFRIPNGPTVVAVGTEVVAEEARILYELNKSGILPQRV